MFLYCKLMQALAPLGAMIGAPLAGVMADRWGRKEALVACGVPYLVGYLLLSYAHIMPSAIAFKWLAITGRLFTGVGMGWAGSCGPVSPIVKLCAIPTPEPLISNPTLTGPVLEQIDTNFSALKCYPQSQPLYQAIFQVQSHT